MALPLNQISGMPRVSGALAGWARPITLNRRTETVTDGLVSYTVTPFTFKGTIQPLSTKQIELKPEGQWAWTWLQIHAVAGTLNLNVNDQIQYSDGTIYKVMAIKDYSLNGYIEYHVANEYQP